MKQGDILYTGKKASRAFSNYYNKMSKQVNKTKDKNLKNYLLNIRHNIFVGYAQDK